VYWTQTIRHQNSTLLTCNLNLTFMWPCIVNVIFLSITNKMQHYTIFFITVNALQVSGGFSAHHQELKTVHTASGICQACLLLPLAWVSWKFQVTNASGSSKQAWHIPVAVYTVFGFWWWAEKPPETCRS